MQKITHTFLAMRSFTARGKDYQPGDQIDPSDWPHRRVELLEGRGFVRRATPEHRTYIARRSLTLGACTYAPGDLIDTTDLSQQKLDQLFELRHITYTDAFVDDDVDNLHQSRMAQA